MENGYKRLKIWLASKELVKIVYTKIRLFPKEEQFALCDQLRRAVVSIPSNIAEGYGRDTHKDFAHFLSLARGSLFEVDTQLSVAVDLGYMKPDVGLENSIEELSKMIASFRTRLLTSPTPTPHSALRTPPPPHSALSTQHSVPRTQHSALRTNMTYGYSYKTSDGVRHESTFEAKSNEAVFAALRAQGIKPMKVWEIHSPYYISKRTRLIIILALALAASLVYTIRLRHSALSTQHSALTAPRHQIYGDPAIWEDIERDNFAAVFPDVGDRILAAFAIPGRLSPGALNLSRQELLKRLTECKDKNIVFDAADSNEATELKKIVQGMKEELRWYVADGVGTVESYLNRLRERQDEEIRIYERTKNELENCTDNALREERNAALRAMGLRTIPRRRNSPSDK